MRIALLVSLLISCLLVVACPRDKVSEKDKPAEVKVGEEKIKMIRSTEQVKKEVEETIEKGMIKTIQRSQMK